MTCHLRHPMGLRHPVYVDPSCLCRLSCRSFFAQEPLIIGLFCGKWSIQIRHPIGLRHPICVDPPCMCRFSWGGSFAKNDLQQWLFCEKWPPTVALLRKMTSNSGSLRKMTSNSGSFAKNDLQQWLFCEKWPPTVALLRKMTSNLTLYVWILHLCVNLPCRYKFLSSMIPPVMTDIAKEIYAFFQKWPKKELHTYMKKTL